MIQPPPLELLVVLVAVALASGVGCTTIGPGGIFVTIALYALTPLSSAEVAGTAHVTFVGVGVVGAVGFARSGELTGDGRALAAILAGTSVLGALAGARLNAHVSRRLFGILLGAAAAATGVALLYRQRRGLEPLLTFDAGSRRNRVLLGGLGVGLGVAAGLVGVGGPVLAVPALVVLGVPVLLAIGVAQVQAIFLSGFATVGYLSYGAVSPLYAAVTGVPLVVGAIAGWVVAHRVDPDRLKGALGVVLLPVGAYLML